jgi:hypothetical protein
MVLAGRDKLETLRLSGAIGDEAYRHVERALDLMELGALDIEAAP